MKETEVTEATIKTLIDCFYTKIRKDPQLGPVFIQAIGKEDQDWKPHLQKMYDFWSSLMLTSGRYHGNPMRKHKEIPPFGIHLFDRWLSLFAETAQEVYIQEIADSYIDKSQRVAQSLKLALYYKTGVKMR